MGRGDTPVELLPAAVRLLIPCILLTHEGNSMEFKKSPDILTVEEASRLLGISTKSCYRLLQQNRIHHVRIGRVYKIPKVHLLSYLQVSHHF